MNEWVVVLAAGAGTRLGGVAKALLDLDGKTFVQRILDTAALPAVVVVGPPHEAAVTRAVQCRVARNAHPERGMLSSVQAGIAALPADAGAALVWPVDVPCVSAATVRALLEAPGDVVAPRYRGRGGHPLRIARARFAELLALDPMRATLRDLERSLIDVDDAGVCADVDTPDDLRSCRDRAAAT